MAREREIKKYKEQHQENKSLNPRLDEDYDLPPMTIARFLELYHIGERDFSNIVFVPGINFSTVKPPLDLTNMKFDSASLVQAVFDNMALDDTTFYNATLTRASFVGIHWVGIETEENSDEEDFEENSEEEASDEESSNQMSPFENAQDLDTTQWGQYSLRPPGVPLIDLDLVFELEQLRQETEKLLKDESKMSSLNHENQRLTRLVEIQATAHSICYIVGEELVRGISDDLETIDRLMQQAYERYEAFNKEISDSKTTKFKVNLSAHPLKLQNEANSQLSPSRTSTSLFHERSQKVIKDYNAEFPKLPSQPKAELEQKSNHNVSSITKKQYEEFTGLKAVVSSNFGVVEDELEPVSVNGINS